LALANAIDFELDKAPAICKTTAQVMKGDKIEKNLCYVKREVTAYQAKKLCEDNGMRLYDPTSSANALKALVLFGSTSFGASRKAQFYVHGRRGNRCQTARGNGALTESSCISIFNAVCEYFEVRHLLCDTTTLNKCLYDSPITKDNMVMYLKSPATYVTVYSSTNIPGSLFLPVDLAFTFPNLESIQAYTCAIATLNRETFAGLIRLKELDLAYNKITELRSSIFEGLISLE
jgi:hypothetical protein